MKSISKKLATHGTRNIGPRSRQTRYCNVCDAPFFPKMSRHLYCDLCRKKSDLLRFAECYPQIADLNIENAMAS